MENKNITLGVFGFGCVGQGLHNVLNLTERIDARIKTICIKHPEKPRTLDAKFFTTDRNAILNDPEIDVVVELIDDADAAFEIVKTALSKGKAVVSANKKMIAEHMEELYELQQKYKTSFLYEGSCCASIPIIRNLEEYYDNDLLNSVEGIFNGSTNFILDKIFEEKLSFDVALKQAQDLGFAETDPKLDIEAFDPKFKLCIILLHAFGLFIKPEDVYNFGIHRLNDFDINYANEKNFKIKLVARCKKVNNKIVAYVLPQFVDSKNKLRDVNKEYNGIVLESVFSESQFFVGKGAGNNPTGSAVLSDISALTYNYKYEYKKLNQRVKYSYHSDEELRIYLRYKNIEEVDFNDFNRIEQRFESDNENYIIGTINLQKIIAADWLKKNDVNIISMN